MHTHKLKVLLALLFMLTAIGGNAQEDSTVTTLLPFSRFGFEEQTLRGSFGAARYVFGLPANWEITSDAALRLQLTNLTSDDADNLATPALLEIVFNDTTLTGIPVDWIGDQTIEVPIPPESLISTRSDGRHDLRLVLGSEGDCADDQQNILIVRPSSVLVVPHTNVVLPLDLRLLPRQIYQRSFEPDEVVIVVPDAPTVLELRAALTVSAGLGRLTNNGVILSLVPFSALSDQQSSGQHLIFVGKPEAFPVLNDSVFQGNAPFADLTHEADDGILQIATSPWNRNNVVLLVSGESDIAVNKAAQALSSGNLRIANRVDAAVIADVQDFPAQNVTNTLSAIDLTFNDLGYANRRISSIGINSLDYPFFVPFGQELAEDAYIDLTFSHSALVDFERSGLIVSINDEPIGSVRLTQESTNVTTVRVPVPRSTVRSGTNVLSVTADLNPQSNCFDSRSESVWLSVWADSILHLPLQPLQNRVTQVVDLSVYPNPFSLDSSLGYTAFVLPEADPVSWDIASQMAYYLGNEVAVGLIDLQTAYADDVPQELRDGYNLIVVGTANTAPIIDELADFLPAPFEGDSNLAVEENMRLIYRLPETADIGYLEILVSPWNSQRAILTVLGSSNQGLQWAASALTTSSLRRRLSGDFAAVSETQITIGDLRLQPVVEATVEPEVNISIVEITPEPTAAPEVAVAQTENRVSQPIEPIGPPVEYERPAWVLPVIYGVSALMALIVVGVLIASLISRRRR